MYTYVEILWQLQPLYIKFPYWLQGNTRRWH